MSRNWDRSFCRPKACSVRKSHKLLCCSAWGIIISFNNSFCDMICLSLLVTKSKTLYLFLKLYTTPVLSKNINIVTFKCARWYSNRTLAFVILSTVPTKTKGTWPSSRGMVGWGSLSPSIFTRTCKTSTTPLKLNYRMPLLIYKNGFCYLHLN